MLAKNRGHATNRLIEVLDSKICNVLLGDDERLQTIVDAMSKVKKTIEKNSKMS
jgi:hypothetical protein